jgi:hypothetical protein
MFTLKMVEYNGHEQIHAVRRVWAEDAPEHGSNSKRVFATAPYDESDVSTFECYGAVYVMNESGATVAKYHLGHGEKKTGTDANNG